MDFHNTIKGQESVSLPWRKVRLRKNPPPTPRLTAGQICLCKWRFIYLEELAEEAEGFQSIASQWGERKQYGIHFTNLTHLRATAAGHSCSQEAASESREQLLVFVNDCNKFGSLRDFQAKWQNYQANLMIHVHVHVFLCFKTQTFVFSVCWKLICLILWFQFQLYILANLKPSFI